MNAAAQTPPKTHRRSLTQVLEKAREYQRIFGPRGWWLALRTKLTHGERFEHAPISGARHNVSIRLNSSDLSTFSKIFLNREYDIPLAKQPKIIIDAGANVGYASAFFALQFPQAKIIAIEPEPANFNLLKQNTSSFPNVSPIKAALWPTSGEVNLLDPGVGSWGFEAADLTNERTDIPKLGTVRAVTVEEIMSQFKLPFVDILKVDIEGGEKALFAGSPAWLKQMGVVMIELHDHRQMGCSRNFFIATRDFDQEIHQGENVFMLRREYVPG
ncbi:MAG TPA: FkbM family methyltransferase [Verrucomicrobiae bacterium]|jgi:FkbM family methyltransferase|nr:FkbM family methyltransferase [Verrucomicrobiae bacterium]